MLAQLIDRAVIAQQSLGEPVARQGRAFAFGKKACGSGKVCQIGLLEARVGQRFGLLALIASAFWVFPRAGALGQHFEGNLTVFSEDGVTPLWTGPVKLAPGGVYRLKAGNEKPQH